MSPFFVRSPALVRMILTAGIVLSPSLSGSAQERALPDLEANVWLVVLLNGETLTARQPATFRFDAGGRVSGSTGCNRFIASYIREGGTLRFTPAAGTRMACPDQDMAQEQRFLAALGEVTHVSAGTMGAVILGGDKGEIFRLVPLR